MSADNHGSTPAAWTGVSIAIIGFVVAAVGLMLSPVNLSIFWVGLAFLPLSLVVWRAMEKLGLGTSQH
jgi:hypothetical protein